MQVTCLDAANKEFIFWTLDIMKFVKDKKGSKQCQS